MKLKDVYLGGLMDDRVGKLVATEENQVLWEFSESESWSVHEDEVTGKPVAYMKSVGKPAASSYDRKPMDEMEDLDVNAVIWRMFMNTTFQAASHLGQDYDQN